jgi:hypothetical protein
MAAVPQHTHQELEDRLTAEVSSMHTELVALRQDVRRGFTEVAQAIAQLAAHLEGGGDGA